jgi:hypothetical protein
MTTAPLGPRFALMAAITLVVLASIPLAIELRGLSGGGLPPSAQAQAIARGQMLPGWSTAAHKRFANRCHALLTGELLRPDEAPLAPALETAVRDRCASGLEQIVRNSPGDAIAWSSLALIRAQNADAQGLFDALAWSRATAPAELWIAARRVRLAEPMLAVLSPADALGHHQDMLVLAQSLRGVRQIATRYLTDLEFRDRIVALVESLSAEDQVRFLQNVRRAAREAGLL